MLRLRVPLLPGESATSFCSRLAHRNRCPSVGEFCRDMGFAFRDVITGTDEALLQLANLGGADIEQLRSCALRFDGFDYACGSNLIEPALRRSMDQLMVCPACVAADLSRWGDAGAAAPAGRTAWLLTPVSICIEHQVALVAADIRPKNAHWRTAEFHDFASRIQPFLREIEHQLDTAERRAPTELECYLSAHKATFLADDRTSNILARILRCLPKGAAGKYVNTPRIQFDLLHKAGIVTPFIKAGGVLKDHGFDTRDLDIFLERLTARARSPVPENVDVTQIPTAAKRASCSTVTVVRMILDGTLDRIYRQADIAGFMSILVDPKEIQAALLKPERTGLSIRQVEARMRWTRNVIRGLTRNGRLPAGSARNPVTKRIQTIIEPKDLDEFDTKYVSLSALSKEKRLFPGTVRAWLGGLGIEPAFDPKAVGATFYRRAELPTA